MSIKFLRKGLKVDGKYIPAWYSGGKLLHHPEGTITVYAKGYGHLFPKELSPENDTDLQTDYFDTDRARILPTNKYHSQIKKIMEKNRKLVELKMKKRGY